MNIIYKTNITLDVDDVIELYSNSGLPRPIEDRDRIEKMLENSNLLISAWEGEKLVGVSRSITDWRWSCYLADLAVRKLYQKHGIGKKLIEITKQKVGDECMVLLLSISTALEYYPKVGFTKQESSFIINRER